MRKYIYVCQSVCLSISQTNKNDDYMMFIHHIEFVNKQFDMSHTETYCKTRPGWIGCKQKI